MQPTVWQALNEPVIEVTEDQAKKVMFAAAVILFAAWVSPYMPVDAATVATHYDASSKFQVVSSKWGTVAGASIDADLQLTTYNSTTVPQWYYIAAEIPTAIADSFAAGAEEVLDISGPVSQMTEFYTPGASAVWNEWLNLMRDPGSPEF